MKQRRRGSWQGCLYCTGVLSTSWVLMNICSELYTSYYVCKQNSFLSKAFTNSDTKQTDVQSNTKKLYYSETQAILLNLFFSHPPSQSQGFNPVTRVSGNHLRPCPKAAGSPPGPGVRRPRPETRGGTSGLSPARRRLPRALFGRAPEPGPDAALVLRHPAAHCTKALDRSPEQPEGLGSSQRADFPGMRRERCRRPGHPPLPLRSNTRLERCSQYRNAARQRSVLPPASPPSQQPKRPGVPQSPILGAFKSNIKLKPWDFSHRVCSPS